MRECGDCAGLRGVGMGSVIGLPLDLQCLLDSFRYLCIKDRMVFHIFFGLGSNSYLTSLVQISRQNCRRQEISEVSK